MRRFLLALTLAAAVAGTGCASFKSGATGSGDADGGGGNDGSGPDGSTGAQGSPDGGAGADAAVLLADGGGTPPGADASRPGDGGAGGDAQGNTSTTGAGPYGDLPSGYCCTADTDCRKRNCVDLGGGNKMCEDECDGAQSLCNGLLPGFVCTFDDAGVSAFCAPPTPTTACVPAAQYTHGTKAVGACCSATGDATAGQECLGGHCGQTGSSTNPFICENACTAPKDCQTAYQCINVGAYNLCLPIADPYTCK